MAVSFSWIALGCGQKADSTTPAANPPSRSAFPRGLREATGPKTPDDSLTAELSKIINDASIKYKSLEYRYDEGLLNILDQAEAHLAGKSKGPVPRAMPNLSEQEEYDHLRETIRRWHADRQGLAGRDRQVEGGGRRRKPGGPAFHPTSTKGSRPCSMTSSPSRSGDPRTEKSRDP